MTYQSGPAPVSQSTLPSGPRPGRILIVEDQSLIGLELEDLIQELGYETAGRVGTIAGALEILATEEVDAALLDVHVQGELCYAVADELLKLGKPWIFISGWNEDVFNGRYPGVTFLSKPVRQDVLAAHIRDMVGSCSTVTR